MKYSFQNLLLFYRRSYRRSAIVLCFIFFFLKANTQCPPNLDFETGTFAGWECSTGEVTFNMGDITWLTCCNPVPNQHTMLTAFPGDGVDYYGLFPQNCPNGSGHSIRLGNGASARGAEKVSYEFTIPAGQDKFNLIYNYAVILIDYGHTLKQSPKMSIEVLNVTDNIVDTCSSFSFIANSALPGFYVSINSPPGLPVRCKNWSANTINLDNHAGKTIRLTFTTADCSQGGHFGYGYVDINTQCSSPFIGTSFCADDTAIDITAPFGYAAYTWYDQNYSQVLGTQQVLHLSPPPPSGSTVAVEIIPYSGYGCKDTLIANLFDTLTIRPNAGRDTSICNNNPVQLGAPPVPGLLYSWSPATALNDPNIANPIATPSVTTQYVLTVTNNGGGCLTTDTVYVEADVVNDSLQLIGSSHYCSASGLTTTLKVFPADSIQWYKDGIPITGANQTIYIVTQRGAYSATLFSFAGCIMNTRIQQVDIYESPVAGFTTSSSTSQCFSSNQFVFTNTSTISSGTLQYSWNLGDGTTATTADVTHSYGQPGTYLIKMLVTAAGNCADSSSITVTVYPEPVAGFTVNMTSQCFKNNRFIFTNTSTITAGNLQYNWDMGDGNSRTSKDVIYSYALPGTYTVKMLVTDVVGGCADSSLFDVTVYVSPVAGFSVNDASQCLPGNRFILTNTSTVFSGNMQYYWNFGDGTTDTAADADHHYAQAGVYLVKLRVMAAGGCADSMLVTLSVHPGAYAEFSVTPVCTNLQVPVINLTKDVAGLNINYLWDFGNGSTSVNRNPVYSYTAPGTYTISLSVNATQCPLTVTTKKLDITVDAPAPGIIYPEKIAVMNFPEPLQARQIGAGVLWTPSISLDHAASYKPNFKGLYPQLYSIRLKTASGCLTVDTQMVKTRKKIEIYVPTVFTPGNGDGLNDYLRPVLMGFIKVNYFRVFNRWGKLIFQMQGDRPGWNGRINGQQQEMQTVVWMIEAVDVDGNVHRRQGSSVLMR